MKKIVIAGAGGYLGANVLPTIAKLDGIALFALSSKEHVVETEKDANVVFFKLGMNDYIKANRILPVKCDFAINFSWIGARGVNQDEEEVQKANEENSINLLKSLIDAGCSKFIQIGSMSEYGVVDGLITEESECHPITSYARRKLHCAERMKEICDESDVDFIEFRMGSMYGNYMEKDNIIGFLCRELMQGHHVTLKTACEQDWEYTHVDDLAEILAKAIQYNTPAGIYNITNGETRKLKEFIEIIEEKFGCQNSVTYGEINQGIGCQNIRCDIEKVKRTFHKKKFISFSDGIDSVINSIGDE